ncbi:glutaminase a [Trichoderma cornu-damae]|uniref:Glutaminase a n=1 Tax=Trichoderma cornu-damae TaxID=654480 RepID=A0A9P8TTJ9_9HYPO|nr:glutaminase a [Trichoderma cornu-damae]
MKLLQVATAALLALAGRAGAVSTFEPARPPAAPLAVRAPYLNVWLNGQTNGQPSGYLPGQWPRFWTQGIQAWQGFVRVDGQVYNWMGGAPGASNVDQQSLKYTSTRTTFTMNVAGKVQLVAEFFSPVFPDDLRRQSIPFSYLSVSVASLDGRSHQVQIYTDVSGEWASGDNSQIIRWEHLAAGGVRSHKFYRQNQEVFNEANDQASWGNWYWSTGDVSGVTYQIGQDTVVRGQFLSSGTLTGAIDTSYRAVRDRWPVFAFARDLGSVGTSGSASTLFTIGVAQDDAILFQGQGGSPQEIPSLWTNYFNEQDLVPFFYGDFAYASQYATSLDNRVASDSIAAGGKDYLTITSLAVRQAFGALQYTGTEDNVRVFLKEISSNSDIQTVDVIFPTWPIMLYLDPNLIKYTLSPLIENQESGHYPNKYAIHDLGRFPQALGYPQGNDEAMPLEECGNMIIMMLSYAQKTGDVDYLRQHWTLMAQWAEYLIEDAKIPANQLNQTNLAIKGIIALEAMSRIAQLTDHSALSANYSSIAHDYFDFWSLHGINRAAVPNHSVLQYDAAASYGLDFIPQSVYDMQSDFYQTKANKYGVVLDTRGTLTKTDWEMFAAAVAKPDTKAMFISLIAKWINETSTWRAFTDLYDTNTGGYPGNQFTARPVVGGVFSLLALK